jgi:hypothetical protein
MEFGNDAVLDETHACLSKIAIDDQRVSGHVLRKGLGVRSSAKYGLGALLDQSM